MTQILFLIDAQTCVVLHTPQKPEEILCAVRTGTWLPPALPSAPRFSASFHNGQVIIEMQGSAPRTPAEAALTPHQARILQEMAEGGTTRQIALRLGISVHTVAWHINAVKDRLGVRTRAQAVIRGAALGLCKI